MLLGYFAQSSADRQLKQAVDSDLVHYLCGYFEDHYSRWNPFLPKVFRSWMHNSSGFIKQQPLNQLMVFHYALNRRRMSKKLKSFANRVNYIDNFRPTDEMFINTTPKKYPENLDAFEGMTAIRFCFTGIGRRVDISLPCMVDKEAEQQKIINRLLASPEDAINFLAEQPSMNINDIKWLDDHTKTVIVGEIATSPRTVSTANLEALVN